MTAKQARQSGQSMVCGDTLTAKLAEPLARWSDDGKDLIIGTGPATTVTPSANAGKMRRYHEGAAARLAGSAGARHRAIADAIAALGVQAERRPHRDALVEFLAEYDADDLEDELEGV